MTLTTKKIHEKADELHKKGINPSLANVRKALGGGSFTTISKAMKQWRQEQEAEQELASVSLPEDINDRLKLLGAEIWQIANDLANKALAEDKKELAKQKKEAKEVIADYADSIDVLEAEKKQLKTNLDVEVNKTQLLKEQLDIMEQTLDDTKKELTEALTTIAKLQQMQEGYKEDIKRLLDDIKKGQKEHNKLTDENKTLVKINNETNTQLAEIRGELNALKSLSGKQKEAQAKSGKQQDKQG